MEQTVQQDQIPAITRTSLLPTIIRTHSFNFVQVFERTEQLFSVVQEQTQPQPPITSSQRRNWTTHLSRYQSASWPEKSLNSKSSLRCCDVHFPTTSNQHVEDFELKTKANSQHTLRRPAITPQFRTQSPGRRSVEVVFIKMSARRSPMTHARDLSQLWWAPRDVQESKEFTFFLKNVHHDDPEEKETKLNSFKEVHLEISNGSYTILWPRGVTQHSQQSNSWRAKKTLEQHNNVPRVPRPHHAPRWSWSWIPDAWVPLPYPVSWTQEEFATWRWN